MRTSTRRGARTGKVWAAAVGVAIVAMAITSSYASGQAVRDLPGRAASGRSAVRHAAVPLVAVGPAIRQCADVAAGQRAVGVACAFRFGDELPPHSGHGVDLDLGRDQDAVNPRAAAISAFDTRLKSYLELRGKVESELPRLQETDDPKKIYEREVALGQAVRTARPDAKPGDVFGRDMSPLLVEIIRKDWRTRSPQDRAALLQADMPKPFVPAVNMTYPSTQPLVTFPPTLLKQLHQLPDELEYRFVGRHLILRDAKANLIVDVLRDVLPSRSA